MSVNRCSSCDFIVRISHFLIFLLAKESIKSVWGFSSLESFTSCWSHLHRSKCSVIARFHEAVAPSLTSTFLVPQQLGSFEALQTDVRRPVEVRFFGIYNDEPPIPFHRALQMQQELQLNHFRRMANHQGASTDKDLVDSILVLQHEPVYTFGTASNPEFLLQKDTGIQTINISRGGEITYHGAGQLVVYPILDLLQYRADLHWYIRALEEVIMIAISSLLSTAASDRNDLKPTRCDHTTGVWLDDHKVAAIGVHARRWVTQHGVAINVEEQCLPPFENIVPCGLVGRKVGCLNQFLDRPITVAEFVPYVLDAMEFVFKMEIVGRDLSTRNCAMKILELCPTEFNKS